MNTYASCILLSAFLLFQIEPIISKTFLPWFGGTPAVWSASMFFFQVLLTAGYAWSNWLVSRGKPKKQAFIQLALLLVSVALVAGLWIIWPSPVTPADSLRPASLSHPLFSIFILLTISVGLPFFVLSTNSPLMQVWFERKHPGKSPWWLYALSNVGSLAGLLTYPILIEPLLNTRQQGWIWAVGYLLFALLAAVNVILTLKPPPSAVITDRAPKPVTNKTTIKTPLLKWILLSACASLLLLAVTSQITQEVAVIPFLWVLPLSIYLLSFVLTYSSKSFYNRNVFIAILFAATTACLIMLVMPQIHFIIQIIIYNIFLFAACMVCNGELYALRPPVARLTVFYLWGSIGGAIGGLFVTLVAPLIFSGYWEMYLGLAFIWLLLWITAPGDAKKDQTGSMAGAMTMVVSMLALYILITSGKEIAFARRNFFGVTTVRQSISQINQKPINILAHGITLHGFQFTDPTLRDTPTSYYTKESGAGLAILNNPHYGSGMRVGVLGLGIGTLAAYGQPGDDYRMYEINPVMVELANGQGGYFSFVKDSRAKIEIVQGDARISLENELKAGRKNNFDVLVLDTFNSDSIPVHLISQQAFEVYLQHLAPDGVIAANISNRRLDLRPVFWQLAKNLDLKISIVQELPQANDPTAGFSDWVLLTRDADLLQRPGLAENLGSLEGFRKDTRLWTDDYSNLIPLLR